MIDQEHKPYVPVNTDMREMTVRALILGLVMCVILGAANAYLGLRAGMTIAATYPAAVIGMAVLRMMKGSLLEENFARTIGSVGESVAAGAIFTIPAFVVLRIWSYETINLEEYLLSSALMIIGGILGVFFVTLLRRVMVEDSSLPFPESVAAAEIHKAGQRGSGAAMQLFGAMGVGALLKLLGDAGVFQATHTFLISMGRVKDSFIRFGLDSDSRMIPAGGATTFQAPAASPAYLGVGYIIGPELASLTFAGGLLAWGLFVPLLIFVLGPELGGQYTGAEGTDWPTMARDLWLFTVRPIAVGGMLVGALYTLFKMRDKLLLGARRGAADLKKSAGAHEATDRTDKDLSYKTLLTGILLIFVLMIALYFYFTKALPAAFMAAVVMIITGFFFAAVSGNLVGMIGTSNNPVSGLTLATTIVAALTMVVIGVKGIEGVAAVLAVAAVVCVSSAIAGEMLQDLKIGYILGGTPWKMQVGELAGVVVSGLVLFFPLYLLHTSDIASNPDSGGFGSANLPAPQAGLMAALSQGIVRGEMNWPLVIVGIAMGLAMILVRVKSPMLVAVGMYLPLATTFAIFTGGLIRWVVDRMAEKRALNAAQSARVENAGVLTASGLIAGEALMGLGVAGVVAWLAATTEPGVAISFPQVPGMSAVAPWLAIPVMIFLAGYLIYRPLGQAGDPDEPAPPPAM
jgi:putative OPT family oligopeptide transporter